MIQEIGNRLFVKTDAFYQAYIKNSPQTQSCWNDHTFKNEKNAEESSVIRQLAEIHKTSESKFRLIFSSEQSQLNENTLYDSLKGFNNIYAVVKDTSGNIFGAFVTSPPSQKNRAVVDKKHCCFRVARNNMWELHIYTPKHAVESFVIFNESAFAFCVPYAFAIGINGVSTISPKFWETYDENPSTKVPTEITANVFNSTKARETFGVEWVKVFVC
ncbi:hypothetical protein EIN_095900 [Entamoeba invadens IP1]|uniref:TLDc domain-containing protein n=1 Tax=Entamoeba invadens IP1 TaxID=370355 RepID=A0A0A1U3M1_ENTIV|nr:hypothetical protein EIN_095900 [Entamoeba invadens IP1]ELP87333.1 hypothetical protein EIN_095900 [Entamoeba invadens IP1]|eukprot:XP_004254104.1 hypothetical protein EIN_095900 [Entamoeba invadens IP1]